MGRRVCCSRRGEQGGVESPDNMETAGRRGKPRRNPSVASVRIKAWHGKHWQEMKLDKATWQAETRSADFSIEFIDKSCELQRRIGKQRRAWQISSFEVSLLIITLSDLEAAWQANSISTRILGFKGHLQVEKNLADSTIGGLLINTLRHIEATWQAKKGSVYSIIGK